MSTAIASLATEHDYVTALWESLLPYETPDKFKMNLWLRQHGAETVAYAIEQVATKRAKVNGDMTADDALRLCGAICCSVSRRKRFLAAAAK